MEMCLFYCQQFNFGWIKFSSTFHQRRRKLLSAMLFESVCVRVCVCVGGGGGGGAWICEKYRLGAGCRESKLFAIFIFSESQRIILPHDSVFFFLIVNRSITRRCLVWYRGSRRCIKPPFTRARLH